MSDARGTEWICSTIDVEGGARVKAGPTDLVSMGVAAKAQLWPRNKTLTVGFLGGSTRLQMRVLHTAAQWFDQGITLKLKRASAAEQADIRIAFNPAGGSFSYIGTDSKLIHPSQPTMNLGWATEQTPDNDFSSVVLHEFGHALGLLHEHNHPGAKIQWDKNAIFEELSGSPNFWDRKTIERNVFAQFDASTVITTDFDQISIMIYTIPGRWTTDGQSFMPSWKLSSGDIATIRSLYA